MDGSVHDEPWNVLENHPKWRRNQEMIQDGGKTDRQVHPDHEGPWNVLENHLAQKNHLLAWKKPPGDDTRWIQDGWMDLSMKIHGMFWETTQHGEGIKR